MLMGKCAYFLDTPITGITKLWVFMGSLTMCKEQLCKCFNFGYLK